MNGRQLLPISVAAACLFLLCLHSLVDKTDGAAVLRSRDRQPGHTSQLYRLEAPATDRVYRTRTRLTPAVQMLVQQHKRQPETVPPAQLMGPMADGDGDEDFVYEEDAAAQQKRYDEYGHMRFGKRVAAAAGDDSDDYGHMRFGKRSEWL